MGGKYSAEWWEKIADINREISARHNPSSVVEAKPRRDGLSSNFVDLVEQS